MNDQAIKRLSILVLVTLLALLATWGTFAASSPDAIVVNKSIVGNVTTTQPGDVITYRIGILNNGGATVTVLMTDTLPTGVRLIGKPSSNLLQGDPPSNINRDIRNRTVGYRADLDAGTGIEILLPVRVGRCYDTTDKTITNEAVVSNVNGAGSISDSVSFTVDCSDTTSLNNLAWSAEFADEPYDATVRGWDEGVAAVKGRFMRLRFKNSGASRLDFRLDMPTTDFRVTLGWTGCLTCTRADDTGHVETVSNLRYEVHVNPGDTYFMDFYVEPTDQIMFETSLPLDIDICLPDFDDGGCEGNDDEGKAQTEQLIYFLTRRDLGDAPDSSNHASVNMAAYPAVIANFPTVHDVTLGVPYGPAHLNSARFHLGNGVSAEFEADIGPDQDPANNIEAPADVPDLDAADDGVNPAAWSFNHCQTTTIPVRVFIHPAAVAAFGDNPGYINIWTDGNRDGDWADVADCNGNPAPEHIVIDAPVDVAALGAGIHTLNVPTGRVPWPVAQANNPAWVRVMLMGVESVKLAGETYGDGRGRALPYASGETEDYLINAAQPFGLNVEGNFANGDSDQFNWRVQFVNQSADPISNLSLDINLPDQAVQQILCNNENLTCATDATGVIVTAPTLPAGARGTVSIRTNVPAGQNVEATAVISGDGTTVLDSKRIYVGNLPVISIKSPVDGTISDETELEIIGRISGDTAGRAPLQLFWDDTFLQTITPNPDGTFVLTRSLAANLRTVGHHNLRVVSGDAEATSSLVVDGIVGFDVATMQVTLPGLGKVYSPFGEDRRLDTNGWRIIMQGNVPHTLTVRSDAQSMRIRYEDGSVVPMVVPEGEPCVFTVQLQPQSRATTAQKLQIEAISADGTVSIAEGFLIHTDTPLTVVDATTGAPLSGITVSDYVERSSPKWSASAWASIGPRRLKTVSNWLNLPDLDRETDSSGQAMLVPLPKSTAKVFVGNLSYLTFRGFEIPATAWTGCLTCTRSINAIPSTTVALAPVPSARAATVDVEIDSTGFNPAYLEVLPGTVINFTNIDAEDHGTMSDSVTFAANGYNSGAWDSGLLASGETFSWEMIVNGEFTYVDPTNPLNIGTIVVTSTPTAIQVSGQSAVNSGQLLLLLLVGMAGLTAIMIRRVAHNRVL